MPSLPAYVSRRKGNFALSFFADCDLMDWTISSTAILGGITITMWTWSIWTVSFITSISGSSSGICDRIPPHIPWHLLQRFFSDISVSRRDGTQFYRWHGYSFYISCHHNIKYHLVWIATPSPDRSLVFSVAQIKSFQHCIYLDVSNSELHEPLK